MADGNERIDTDRPYDFIWEMPNEADTDEVDRAVSEGYDKRWVEANGGEWSDELHG